MAYKPPYLLLYVNDLLGSHYVDLMDMEQFGWYMRLLVRSWQWDTPCYLPNDMAVIRSILRIGRRQKEIEIFSERFQIVYERFSITEDGTSIYHPKLVEQYEELKLKHERLAEAGLRGGLSSGKARLKQPDSDPEPDSDSLKPKPSAFALPDWITQNPQLLESWRAFVEMRKKMRATLTQHGIKLTIRDLVKLAEQGNDPKQVLDQSVARSWRGVFELKRNGNGNGNGNGITKAQQRQNANIDAAKAAIARIRGVDCEAADGTGDGDERDSDTANPRVVREAPIGPHPVTLEGVIRKMS